MLDEILRLRKQRYTWDKIGGKLGIKTEDVIKTFLIEVKRLRETGIIWHKIVSEIGISYDTIKILCERYMPELLESRGLKEQQKTRIEVIKNLHADGLTWGEIGAKIGLTRAGVAYFVKSHIPGLTANPR